MFWMSDAEGRLIDAPESNTRGDTRCMRKKQNSCRR